MAEVHNRRRSLLIDKKFQSKFIAVGLATTVALVLGIFILWFSSHTGQPAEPAGGAPSPTLTPGFVILLIFILVLVIVTVMYGLRFSHRVVGPIFAFNRHMNWIREGNFTRDLKLREGDEFEHLAETFNAMQSSLRRRTRDDLEALMRIQKMIDELADAMKTASFDAASAATLVEAIKAEFAAQRKRQEGLLA
jgi:methyl-accepting chemotaxis protein